MTCNESLVPSFGRYCTNVTLNPPLSGFLPLRLFQCRRLHVGWSVLPNSHLVATCAPIEAGMAEACDNAWMYSVKAYGLSQGIVVADGFECRGLPPGACRSGGRTVGILVRRRSRAAKRAILHCQTAHFATPYDPFCSIKRPVLQVAVAQRIVRGGQDGGTVRQNMVA